MNETYIQPFWVLRRQAFNCANFCWIISLAPSVGNIQHSNDLNNVLWKKRDRRTCSQSTFVISRLSSLISHKPGMQTILVSDSYAK
jgi:hypothetical protein